MNIYTLACNIPFLILAIIGIGFLIAFHELGHFLFCKLFKVSTPSFSIGFGPRIFQKKIGETTFALSAIPLGGYVEIAGAHELGQGEQKEAFRDDQYSFSSKPYYQKMLIIAGGILFNLIFAYAALSALFYIGSPCIGKWCANEKPIVLSTAKNSSGQKANLEKDDLIIKINDKPVETIEQVNKITNDNINKNINLTIIRKSKEEQVSLAVGSKKISVKGEQAREVPVVGITWYMPPVGILKALSKGLESTITITKDIFKALGSLFYNKSTEGIGGPLMLISQVTKSAEMGMRIFLFILALISINLAVFNLLPFPIFDGGQALLFTIEAIKGSPVSLKTKENIHYVTWIAVIILVVFLTYKDILKLISC